MRKPISQREARAARKELKRLREVQNCQLRAWNREWPGGKQISSMNMANIPAVISAINTARLLSHAVVVTVDENTVRFHALELPK